MLDTKINSAGHWGLDYKLECCYATIISVLLICVEFGFDTYSVVFCPGVFKL